MNAMTQYRFLLALCGTLVLGISFNEARLRDRTFGDSLPMYLQQFDVDESGVLDEEERQAAKEDRENHEASTQNRWDKDGDGQFSKSELNEARDYLRERIADRRHRYFSELAGTDGYLSPQEFSSLSSLQDVKPERRLALFNRMDANRDGWVVLDEFLARLRHHRKPGDDPHLPPPPPRPTRTRG